MWILYSMKNITPKNIQSTTLSETLLTVLFIDHYSNPDTKKAVHRHKFESNTFNQSDSGSTYLLTILLDICIYVLTSKSRKSAELTIFTCPPSTMYERREKSADSMWALLKSVRGTFPQYFNQSSRTHVLYKKIFKIDKLFLHSRRAQHINSTRKSRTSNIDNRYHVRLMFKLYVFCAIKIRQISHFHICIVDDVTSTGGTLLSCRNVLEKYFKTLQKKKPEISYDIQVFSLTH